jgi:hypothetical protein
MNMREFLESRRKAEYPTFVKVLKALPLGASIIVHTKGLLQRRK